MVKYDATCIFKTPKTVRNFIAKNIISARAPGFEPSCFCLFIIYVIYRARCLFLLMFILFIFYLFFPL